MIQHILTDLKQVLNPSHVLLACYFVTKVEKTEKTHFLATFQPKIWSDMAESIFDFFVLSHRAKFSLQYM